MMRPYAQATKAMEGSSSAHVSTEHKRDGSRILRGPSLYISDFCRHYSGAVSFQSVEDLVFYVRMEGRTEGIRRRLGNKPAGH